MKLSEAIRLGAVLGPQKFGAFRSFTPGDDSTCALGSAMKAIGSDNVGDLLDTFSWMKAATATCPECHTVFGLGGAVICLNDMHRWTRERIADWVETIEPAETIVQIEQPIVETVNA